MMNAMMGMSQQKKAMIKQREMSSVSILLISPYFTMRMSPSAAIPTTTMDQPRMSHLKKSDKTTSSEGKNQVSIFNYKGLLKPMSSLLYSV